MGERRPSLLLVKARIEQHLGQPSAPALGVMYLGAMGRACGWEVHGLDTYLVDDPAAALREAIERHAPDVVGLSALTSESRSLHALARTARAAAPEAVILAGGAHASAYPEECLENEAIDAVAIGEGELTLRDILDRIRTGADWKSVPGIVVRGARGFEHTATRPYIEDLDTLPMPAWDLTDVDAYSRRKGQSLAGLRRYMPLMTSRGCPYRCTYCHDIQGKRFRAHSPEFVMKMLDELEARHGVHHFDIVDDIFNFDAERMDAVCDAILARGKKIGFTFPNGVRADRMTLEQVDKLVRAGCEYVAIAIETATPRLQKQVRKHLRFDKVLPVIAAFTERNVLTAGYFMLGFPSETADEIRATIAYAIGSKLHVALFFVVTPFQGTELHDQLAAVGRAQRRDLTELYVLQKINLSEVADAEFFRLRRNAYLRFYLDPVRMWRILRAMPRRAHLFYLTLLVVRDTFRVQPASLLRPYRWVRRLVKRSAEDGYRSAEYPRAA